MEQKYVLYVPFQGALAPEKERKIAKELNDYGKAHEDIRFYGPGIGVGVPGEGKVRLGKGYGKSLLTKIEDLEEMLGEEVEVVSPRNLPDGPKTLLWPYGRFPFLPTSVEAKEGDSAEAIAEIFERHGLETDITTVGANTAEQVVNPLTIGAFVLALGAGLGLRSFPERSRVLESLGLLITLGIGTWLLLYMGYGGYWPSILSTLLPVGVVMLGFLLDEKTRPPVPGFAMVSLGLLILGSFVLGGRSTFAPSRVSLLHVPRIHGEEKMVATKELHLPENLSLLLRHRLIGEIHGDRVPVDLVLKAGAEPVLVGPHAGEEMTVRGDEGEEVLSVKERRGLHAYRLEVSPEAATHLLPKTTPYEWDLGEGSIVDEEALAIGRTYGLLFGKEDGGLFLGRMGILLSLVGGVGAMGLLWRRSRKESL